MNSVIRVAKENKDLRDKNVEEESLNTNYFMPKIVVQKQITTTDSLASPATTTHGLTYAPLCIRYVRGYTNSGAYKVMPFGAIGVNNEVDNTYIYGYYGEIYNPNTDSYEQPIYYAVIFSDSINSTTDETPDGEGPELLVYDDSTSNPKYRATAPRCDYLKVSDSDVLTLSVPSSSLANGNDQSYSTSYTHGKGYLPVVAPFDAHFDFFLLNEYYGGGLSNIPSTIILNDVGSQLVEQVYSSYSSPDLYEYITYYFNGTGLYLEYNRLNITGSTVSCPARSIKLYYTVFENRLDEAFSLL